MERPLGGGGGGGGISTSLDLRMRRIGQLPLPVAWEILITLATNVIFVTPHSWMRNSHGQIVKTTPCFLDWIDSWSLIFGRRFIHIFSKKPFPKSLWIIGLLWSTLQKLIMDLFFSDLRKCGSLIHNSRTVSENGGVNLMWKATKVSALWRNCKTLSTNWRSGIETLLA